MCLRGSFDQIDSHTRVDGTHLECGLDLLSLHTPVRHSHAENQAALAQSLTLNLWHGNEFTKQGELGCWAQRIFSSQTAKTDEHVIKIDPHGHRINMTLCPPLVIISRHIVKNSASVCLLASELAKQSL